MKYIFHKKKIWYNHYVLYVPEESVQMPGREKACAVSGETVHI